MAMQQAMVAALATRIAALPDWCFEVLDDGVLGFLECLCFDPEVTGTLAQKQRTALAVLNGDPGPLDAVCAAEDMLAAARGEA
jgi:hypothetical protein